MERILRVLGDYSSGRDNNFNLLRVLAALFIAFYHCYFNLLGPDLFGDRYSTPALASQIVLNFFFLISGFLIAQSFINRRDVVSYFVARVLRLVPGLFVLALFICLLIGPAVTGVSLIDYFTSAQTLAYVPFTTLMDPDRTLPGVFTLNPNPNELDVSIWTLRYEVICYIGLCIIGVLGFLDDKFRYALVVAVALTGYCVISYLTPLREIEGLDHLLHFGLSFIAGTTFYVFRQSIPLHFGYVTGLVLLALLIGKYASWHASEPFTILATGYAVFWFAFIPAGSIRAYNGVGDYSYGVYIYHYPVEQTLVHYFGAHSFSPVGLFAVMLPLVIFFAFLSWHLIERPSLRKLSTITNWLKSSFSSKTRTI